MDDYSGRNFTSSTERVQYDLKIEDFRQIYGPGLFFPICKRNVRYCTTHIHYFSVYIHTHRGWRKLRLRKTGVRSCTFCWIWNSDRNRVCTSSPLSWKLFALNRWWLPRVRTFHRFNFKIEEAELITDLGFLLRWRWKLEGHKSSAPRTRNESVFL